MFFLLRLNPLEFPLTGPDVSVQCLEPSVRPHQRPVERGARRDPDLAHRFRAALHHSGCGAVTHPLSVSWDGVEVRVNCGSAVERPVLLSVSENEGYEREGDE